MRFRNLNGCVQISERHAFLEKLDSVHWDDLLLFRTVATSDSFRQAATKLAVSVNTVRSRIERLETALETTLLSRSYDGIRLSDDGQAILNVTLDMQASSLQLRAGVGNNLLVQPGEIRVSCAESLGAFWLTPFISDLNALLPDHRVVLQNEYNQTLIHTRDSDICIGYLRPNNPETIVTKIATVHQMPFASKSYLEKFGTPKSVDDLLGHKVILFEAPGLNTEAVKLFVGTELLNKVAKNTFNTGYSFLWSVSNGSGIAVLPTYAPSLSDTLVPLDIPVRFKFDIWLSFHHSGKESKPVREAIKWLQSCFDQARYPWFSDSFIHPNDFTEQAAEIRIKRQPFAI